LIDELFSVEACDKIARAEIEFEQKRRQATDRGLTAEEAEALIRKKAKSAKETQAAFKETEFVTGDQLDSDEEKEKYGATFYVSYLTFFICS